MAYQINYEIDELNLDSGDVLFGEATVEYEPRDLDDFDVVEITGAIYDGEGAHREVTIKKGHKLYDEIVAKIADNVLIECWEDYRG